ncbi:MAG: glycosyltransferase, partial [Candidatus Methanomethylicaceae archaeon]
EAKAGMLANTPEEFAEALLAILQNPDKRDQLSRNALSFAEPYDWDQIAKQFENRIFSLYAS